MPRRLRFCPAGMPVHVIQRGNNRQTYFEKDADMAANENLIAEYSDKLSALYRTGSSWDSLPNSEFERVS